MRRSLLFVLAAAGVAAASGVAVTAAADPQAFLPSATAAAQSATQPAPSPAPSPMAEVVQSGQEVQRQAEQVARDVTAMVADYSAWRSKVAAELSSTEANAKNVRVGATDESRTLGINNRILWFDGITVAPCQPYLLSSYGAYYCNLDDTIYVGSWVDTLTRGQRLFVYAHEDGHSEPHTAFATVNEEEAYADQFGGHRLRELRDAGVINDRDVAEARDLLASIGDSDHGTGTSRIEAFDRGYNG